jgi:hypothetical protein
VARNWGNAKRKVGRKERGRFGLQHYAGLLTVVAAAAAALFVVAGASGGGVTGAAFTTTDTSVDGTGHCKNGNEDVNCNIYDGKEFVWLNGGPSVAYVNDGTYFFAVLAPGGQHDPIDGAANNLSDETLAPWTAADAATNSDGSTRPSGDTYQDRTFTVTGGAVSYSGSHAFEGNKINLMPYDDTTNNGGVYILAICSLKDGYAAVTPSNCKYDAFKVAAGDTTTPPASPPTVTKDAAGTYNTSYTWDAAKSVATPSSVNLTTGTSATFHYTVTATHSAGTNSGVAVTGGITITNGNSDSIVVHVADQLSDTTNCTVKNDGTPITGSDDVSVPANATTGTHLTYACSIGGSTVPSSLTNTVTVSWPEQLLDDGSLLGASGSSPATFTYPNDGSYIGFAQTKIDGCATITDTFGGSPTTLGDACVGGVFTQAIGNTLTNFQQNPAYNSTTRTFSFKYDRVVARPATGCVTKNNTANFSTNTTGATDGTLGDNSASVTVCRVVLPTGALTIGFWQNKNGQGIISGANQSALGAWLRGYHPFSNAPSTGLAVYVSNIIKAATCSGTTCNAMLKAQMLATALDVYFSNTALGGNKINAPSAIGSVSIDLTQICKMIDGTGGTATCSGSYEDASSQFGGSPKTVLEMLAYQNTSDPAVDAGALWYSNVKATQVVAKDAFDAINNQVAFAS